MATRINVPDPLVFGGAAFLAVTSRNHSSSDLRVGGAAVKLSPNCPPVPCQEALSQRLTHCALQRQASAALCLLASNTTGFQRHTYGIWPYIIPIFILCCTDVFKLCPDWPRGRRSNLEMADIDSSAQGPQIDSPCSPFTRDFSRSAPFDIHHKEYGTRSVVYITIYSFQHPILVQAVHRPPMSN